MKSLAEESEEMDRKNRVCSKAMAFIQGSLKFASAPCSNIMIHMHHSNIRPCKWLLSKSLILQKCQQ